MDNPKNFPLIFMVENADFLALYMRKTASWTHREKTRTCEATLSLDKVANFNFRTESPSVSSDYELLKNLRLINLSGAALV